MISSPNTDSQGNSDAYPSSGCAALAALSPLAARTVLRCSEAWCLLSTEVQANLLRCVSAGPLADSARAAFAELMATHEWTAGAYAQKSALEDLAHRWWNVTA